MLIMTIDDKIIDEKMQQDIYRAKISALSLKLINMNNILPLDQNRITEQAKFTFSPLGKVFEKQIKTIEEQGKNNLKLQKF